MTEIHVERNVAAPAARVWEVMTDVERTPEVLSSVREVRRLDDGDGFGVGTRWRETRVVMGRDATEEMQVTAVDQGRAYRRGRKPWQPLRVGPRGRPAR